MCVLELAGEGAVDDVVADLHPEPADDVWIDHHVEVHGAAVLAGSAPARRRSISVSASVVATRTLGDTLVVGVGGDALVLLDRRGDAAVAAGEGLLGEPAGR